MHDHNSSPSHMAEGELKMRELVLGVGWDARLKPFIKLAPRPSAPTGGVTLKILFHPSTPTGLEIFIHPTNICANI